MFYSLFNTSYWRFLKMTMRFSSQRCKTTRRHFQRWSLFSAWSAGWKLSCLSYPAHCRWVGIQCEFLNWIQDSWWARLHESTIKTPPGMKCYGPCLHPTYGRTQLLGGPRQRQAWGPFNYTLSVYTHCSSYAVKLGQSRVCTEGLLLVVKEDWSLQKYTYCVFMLVKLLIVTLIIIISNIHSPLAPNMSWHGCTLTIIAAAQELFQLDNITSRNTSSSGFFDIKHFLKSFHFCFRGPSG